MAQLQKGTTYTTGAPNNLVTAANLNALVDNATLLPGAITDQSALTTTDAADTVLVHDASATALKKVTLANLLPAESVTAAELAATLDLSGKTVTLANGEVSAAELAATLDLSGKTVTLPATSVTAAMLAATLDLSAKTVTLPAAVSVTKATPGTASVPAAGGLAQIAHGLGAVPTMVRVVLRCTTIDHGWQVGDEVDAHSFHGAGSVAPFAIYADATNINILRTNLSISCLRKSDGSPQTITTTRWELKAYAWL